MTQTDATSLTERQRYWLKHIHACDAAGQTSIDYAREHGINALEPRTKMAIRSGLKPL